MPQNTTEGHDKAEQIVEKAQELCNRNKALAQDIFSNQTRPITVPDIQIQYRLAPQPGRLSGPPDLTLHRRYVAEVCQPGLDLGHVTTPVN